MQEKINCTLRWVKGHQDDNKPDGKLGCDAKINQAMDLLAKEECKEGHITEMQPYEGSGTMLRIKGKWITTNYREHIILEAIMSKHHQKFFLGKYTGDNGRILKSIDDYDQISWQGIGNTRKVLTARKNVRIMKLLNGWLNTGIQKGLFRQTREYPCCGAAEETTAHMFQCREPTMKETRDTSFKTLKKYYHQHDIPAIAYVPLAKLLWLSSKKNTMAIKESVSPIVRTAVESQTSLGIDFTLLGYLSEEWYSALMTINSDKAQQHLRHLHLGIWQILFIAIWEQRNIFLHGKDSISMKYELEKLTMELHEWKQVAGTPLGYQQTYLINYSNDEITQWKQQQ